MSRALIELVGEDVLCSLAEGDAELRLPYAAPAERLAAWDGVLQAFARSQTTSPLLLTSHYNIRHPDGAGGDGRA